MNWRHPLGLAAYLGLIHNALRLLAYWRLGDKGWWNYLQPVTGWRGGRPVTLDGWGVVAVAALAYASAAIFWMWLRERRPRPENAGGIWGAALFYSLFLGVPLTVLSVVMITVMYSLYGVALFVLLPFALGFVVTSAVGHNRPLGGGDAALCSSIVVLVVGLALLFVAIEGALCLIMALPIALPLSILGGLAARAMQGHAVAQGPLAMLLFFGVSPAGVDVEHAIAPKPSLFAVTTGIEIEAPVERIWQTVLQPAVLRKPVSLVFRAGVAYPRASHIEGSGPLAIRYCDFSTGKLVEPVLIWDEPRQLRFRVASNPLPMEEWSPYAKIHPPHLEGFLVSRQGEFRLTALSSGRTRLEAATWYQHNLWPEQYWRWWSDAIIHEVHGMVLENIRERAIPHAMR
jgi:hypothetical protein